MVNEIVSLALAPIWKFLVPNSPLSNLLLPKEVVSAIRVNSLCKADNSFCIAPRSAAELEPLADCNDKSRIRCKILVDSFIAPSAVCAIEIPSLALRIATPIPLIWLDIRFDICKPAASSLALLMRMPVDKRSIDVERLLFALFKLSCDFIEVTLVLTVIAIGKILFLVERQDSELG